MKMLKNSYTLVIFYFFADERKPGYTLSAWKPGEYVTHCIRHVRHIKKIVNLQKFIGSGQLCAGVFMTGEKLGRLTGAALYLVV